MQIKLSEKDVEDLKEFDKLLNDLYKGKFVGAIISRKRKALANVYERVTDDFCSTCNDRWIRRLAGWYIKAKEHYKKINKENGKVKKAKSKAKANRSKEGTDTKGTVK